MQEHSLLVATGNPGKFREIKAILNGLPLKFVSLKDLGITGEGFEEDGETFEDNAFKKAQFFGEKAGGMMTLGEDSGIFVNALAGELGVKTRRWGAGEHATDQEWVDHFLDRMKDVEDRRARFVSTACLYDPKCNLKEFVTGEVLGTITHELMAPICPGLPLTSCFVPEGYEEVYEKLPKNDISHRAESMKGVREILERRFA